MWFPEPDLADITFAVHEFCQRMSDPSQHSFTKLKWLVRYLKREAVEPRVRIREHEFRGLVGRHILKYTSKNAVIARSSALGASEAKGIESMMRDLGFAVKPVLVFNAESDRTHFPSTWNRQNETHLRGAFVVAR